MQHFKVSEKCVVECAKEKASMTPDMVLLYGYSPSISRR